MTRVAGRRQRWEGEAEPEASKMDISDLDCDDKSGHLSKCCVVCVCLFQATNDK